MFGPLLDVQASLVVAGAMDSGQKQANGEGFVAVSERMASVERLKRMCKDACCEAGSMQETCSSEMLGGQCADFLR